MKNSNVKAAVQCDPGLYREDGSFVPWNTLVLLGKVSVSPAADSKTGGKVITFIAPNLEGKMTFPAEIKGIGKAGHTFAGKELLLSELEFLSEDGVRFEDAVFNGNRRINRITVMPNAAVTAGANSFREVRDSSGILEFPLQNLVSAGNRAFSESALSGEADMPKLTRAGNYAFGGSKISGKLTLAQNCTVREGAFGNTKITAADIPTIHVPSKAFILCMELREASIAGFAEYPSGEPEAPVQAGSFAIFDGCDSLKKLTLPATAPVTFTRPRILRCGERYGITDLLITGSQQTWMESLEKATPSWADGTDCLTTISFTE